jgi:alpha-ketoglutarate-dependent taurine dioxygenase
MFFILISDGVFFFLPRKHWDVQSVEAAENIAYSNKKLGWHQDLLYFESPPGIQLLHCKEQAEEGGETGFMDAVEAADRFEKLFPEEFALLSKTPVTYNFSNMG